MNVCVCVYEYFMSYLITIFIRLICHEIAYSEWFFYYIYENGAKSVGETERLREREGGEADSRQISGKTLIQRDGERRQK